MSFFNYVMSPDSRKYKQLRDNLSGTKHIHLDDDSMLAAEKMLGKDLTPDMLTRDAGAVHDIMPKLRAYKARKALAEYLLRTDPDFSPYDMFSWPIDNDTRIMAILSVTDPNSFREYGSKDYSAEKIRNMLSRLSDEVPDELFTENEANTAKYDRTKAARKKAAPILNKLEGDPDYGYDEYNIRNPDSIREMTGRYDKYPNSAVTDEEHRALTEADDTYNENVFRLQDKLHPGKGLLSTDESTELGKLALDILKNDLGRDYGDREYPAPFNSVSFNKNDWEKHRGPLGAVDQDEDKYREELDAKYNK